MHDPEDYVTLEDGFKYFWVVGKGALSADDLRSVADYLDKQNEEWLNSIIEKIGGNK